MQHNLSRLKDKLFTAIDKDYNVVNMGTVTEVLSGLERFPLSKELLEESRLGLHINLLRRHAADPDLAKRAKNLVRTWRDKFAGVEETQKKNHKVNSVSHRNVVNDEVDRCEVPHRIPRLNQVVSNHKHGKYVTSPDPSSTSTSPGNVASSPGTSQTVSPAVSRGTAPAISPAIALCKQGSPALTSRSLTPRGSSVSVKRVSTSSPNVWNSASMSRPVSSYAPNAEAVSRTNAANKRLRKDDDDEDRPAKRRQVVNGDVDTDNSSELPGEPVKVPKKERRNSKNTECDVLKQKFASIARTPKVKTTEQLLEDLARRSSSPMLPCSTDPSWLRGNSSIEPSRFSRRAELLTSNMVKNESHAEVTANKNELLEKFFQSQRCDSVASTEDSTSNSVARPGEVDEPIEKATVPDPDDEVAAILAQLPPVNLEEISWESDEEIPRPRQEADKAAVERLIHTNIPSVNGNYDHNGEFREWHETLSLASYQGDLLHILPYTTVD